MTRQVLLLLLCWTCSLFGSISADDDAGRKEYLAQRAAEKAAAEQTVADLKDRAYSRLSSDELIRLSRAYNELGDNPKALAAVCAVPDSVLAEKKELLLKASCFHNVNYQRSEPSLLLRELIFIDRCLDNHYGDPAMWLWRKANVVCQSSVISLSPQGPLSIVDREQYDYSFELLKRALEVEPHDHKFSQMDILTASFPLLRDEPRFKELLKQYEHRFH